MGNISRSNVIFRNYHKKDEVNCLDMNLSHAKINTQYNIKDIITDDEEIKHFLFTLGCYKGEQVTLISALTENYIISVKDARYSIDKDLAESIVV